MSLTINVNAATTQNIENKQDTKRNSKSIFAGDLGIGNTDTNSLIAQKRGTAQRKALKLIGVAWDKDNELSDKISDMEADKSKKLSAIRDLGSKLDFIEEEKNTARTEYGIDPDSQEQKDLELLEKYQNYKGGVKVDDFSKEEIERLSELQYIPRTDYQNKILSLNAVSTQLSADKYNKQQQLKGMTQYVTDATTEQDKSQDMLKAQDNADTIMEATNKEIYGMLIQDGVDNLDDKMEETEEKAEEASEEKEEQQEKIDKAKENREEQEEILDEEQEANQLSQNAELSKKSMSNVEEAQLNIEKIMKDNNLVKEDLKGIKIDFNF